MVGQGLGGSQRLSTLRTASSSDAWSSIRAVVIEVTKRRSSEQNEVNASRRQPSVRVVLAAGCLGLIAGDFVRRPCPGSTRLSHRPFRATLATAKPTNA